MKLSQPSIVEPVYGLGKAVVVYGHKAGAEVTIFRFRAVDGKREQIGHRRAPKVDRAFNIEVQQLSTDDKVFAVQECQIDGQLTKSDDPPLKFAAAVALPHGPLRAPHVDTPMYVCARAVGVGDIVNGATVKVFHQGVQFFEGPVGCPTLIAGVPPLEPKDEVYAVQYFPDILPAESQRQYAEPYPAKQLPAPRIRKPLIECAPSFEVEGLVVGARLFVEDKTSGNAVADQVVTAPLISVDAGTGLECPHELAVFQELCGEPDRSPSDTVVVQPIEHLAQFVPTIVGEPKPTDSVVVVSGLHESTVRIVADGQDIGGGTCYGTTAFNVLTPMNKPIKPVQSFDCRGATWEKEGLALWPIAEFEVFVEDELELIQLINQARKAVKCDPLQQEPKLMAAARAHSQDLARHPGIKDQYGSNHYGSDGSLGWDENGKPGRITIAMGKSGAQGENVGESHPNAKDQFDGWFASKAGHKETMLACYYKLIGVGAAEAPDGTRYYTADFFG